MANKTIKTPAGEVSVEVVKHGRRYLATISGPGKKHASASTMNPETWSIHPIQDDAVISAIAELSQAVN